LGKLVYEPGNTWKPKLVCDDFGLGNVLVKGEDDPTIVAVVDWEWPYAGPAQLAATIPWWLLRDSPVNQAWDCDVNEHPELAKRFSERAEFYSRILEEEVIKRRDQGHAKSDMKFFNLVKWSKQTGAMWLHMILLNAFLGRYSFPLVQLQKILGKEWKTLEASVSQEEVGEFVRTKVAVVEQYYADYDKVHTKYEQMKKGELETDEFVKFADEFVQQTKS
jgi:hypothetical protein